MKVKELTLMVLVIRVFAELDGQIQHWLKILIVRKLTATWSCIISENLRMDAFQSTWMSELFFGLILIISMQISIF